MTYLPDKWIEDALAAEEKAEMGSKNKVDRVEGRMKTGSGRGKPWPLVEDQAQSEADR